MFATNLGDKAPRCATGPKGPDSLNCTEEPPVLHPERLRSGRAAAAEQQQPPAVGPDGRFLWPSHSQKPKNAPRLAQEVGLVWVKPAAQAPPWLRESFRRRRPTTSALWAYTTDSRGRIVRAFIADKDSIAAYAELRANGWGTCPIEAVWPPSITPGQPAEPAHTYLLQLQGVGQ